MIEAKNIADAMNRVAKELADGSLAPGFEKCHDILRDQVQENFDAGGSPLGTWPPHAPATVRKHGPHPLLILTGEMEASSVNKGSPGHIETTAAREATFGTNNWKAPFHQYGTSRIPERPFMVASDETLDACAEEIADAGLAMLLEAL